MKAIAKVTSHMEGCQDEVWIVKGNIYDLEKVDEPEPNLYHFIDEAGEDHYINVIDFDEVFKEVQE